MGNNSTEKKGTSKEIVRLLSLYFLQYVFICFAFFLILVFNQKGFINAKNYILDSSNVAICLYVLITIALLVVLVFTYYFFEDRKYAIKTSNVIMIFSIFFVSIIICSLISFWERYARPFALCALLSLLLLNRRSGIFNNLVFSIFMVLVDTLVANGISFINKDVVISLVINVLAGTFAVFIIDKNGSRLKVLAMGLIISIPIIISVVCFEIYSNTLSDTMRCSLMALISGVSADVLMIILLPFFEITFKALTNFRLAELSDHNSKLIKELQLKAPGTFNHTVIVAMLAEACGSAIGENPLLARACAYYHDMGKLKNPNFFAENQSGYNPHDDLNAEVSASMIKDHAKDGAKLIRKYHLPEVLADTAEQHHGTMLIRVFYAKAQKYTDGVLSVENYSYSGPKPLTKINAIIMICDACEAKVRSIKERTYENLDKAVKEIIEERMDMEQFTECDITLKELDIIKNTITNNFAGVYHDRLKYPKIKLGGKRG